jgi:endoglucanase
MNRRTFIRIAGITAVSATAPLSIAKAAIDEPSAERLPKWRGFNLLEKFTQRKEGNPPFEEGDFVMMREWGFDFARLPMSYLCWADPADWLKLREPELKHIDSAVELGRKYEIHVNLNFHRAPGYCVNPPKEPLDLWKDEKALEACAFHWAHFAKRYKDIPNKRLSFDLLNEPPDIPERDYVRVATRLTEAIRKEDPQRLVIADGLRWGGDPVLGLAGPGLHARLPRAMEGSRLGLGFVEPPWLLRRARQRPAGCRLRRFPRA